MNILILHGIDGHAGIHWQQWLYDQLAAAGHNVVMPDLPDAGHPDRHTWLGTVQLCMATLDPAETIIVGHSLGVTTALDYLEELDGTLLGLVSVSGFYYPLGSELNEYFMQEKVIDMERVQAHTRNVYVVYGDDDPYVPQPALADVAEKLDVQPLVIPNGGHINTSAGYLELPQVLAFITELMDKAGAKA